MTTNANAVVAQITGQLRQAWNAADGAAYASGFTADASFVDIRGGFHQSRAEIGAGHQKIFDTFYRGSTLDATVQLVRDLGDVVLAQVRLDLHAPHATLPPNDGSIATLVLLRDEGEWRIAHFQNTLRLQASVAAAWGARQ